MLQGGRVEFADASLGEETGRLAEERPVRRVVLGRAPPPSWHNDAVLAFCFPDHASVTNLCLPRQLLQLLVHNKVDTMATDVPRVPCNGLPASQQWWLSCKTQAPLYVRNIFRMHNVFCADTNGDT